MKTKRLKSYQSFVNAGRPYTPVYDVTNNRLLLPNFSKNGGSYTVKNKRRLVISSGTVYNTASLCGVWVCCASCQGFRYRWLYFKNTKYGWFRLWWCDLSTYEKAIISRAYKKQRDSIPIPIAPSRNYEDYAAWL
jgi:hypothetical protein